MSKIGLLFSEAPENRYELFCSMHMRVFEKIEEFIEHYKTAHDYSMESYELPARPIRRFKVIQEELDNLKDRKCFCGKEKKDFDPRQFKYCSQAHAQLWLDKTTFWNFHRRHILQTHTKAEQFCDSCGAKSSNKYNFWHDDIIRWNVDHIIAIMNGGHPWHEDNLQVLCEDCHKIKTKQDHADRKEEKIKNSYVLLDEFEMHESTRIRGINSRRLAEGQTVLR